MKKIALLVATITLTTGLVGCSSNGTTGMNKNTGNKVAQNSAVTENRKETGTNNGVLNNNETANNRTGTENKNNKIESGVLGVNDTNNTNNNTNGNNGNNNTLFGIDLTNHNYTDGVYRGAYINEDELSVEFTLANNQIKDIKFISLANDSKNKNMKSHYEALIKHLEGKDIRQSLNDLYNPTSIVKDMDKNVEAGKLTSAIHDALNRGVYNPTHQNNNKGTTNNNGTTNNK